MFTVVGLHVILLPMSPYPYTPEHIQREPCVQSRPEPGIGLVTSPLHRSDHTRAEGLLLITGAENPLTPGVMSILPVSRNRQGARVGGN